MPPKRQHRKHDAAATDRWLDRAPLLSVVHVIASFGIALAITEFAMGLMLREVISDSAFYGVAIIVFSFALVSCFLTGFRRRKQFPEDEQYYCEICHRVISYRQRQRTLNRFPDKHFEQLCQRCRDIVFEQAAWDEQRNAIHQGVLPFFLIFSLACIANMAFMIISPMPSKLRDGLVEADLQVLRFERGDRMLVAVHSKEEVSLLLPGDFDILQQVQKKDLQQGDFVTALVDDKTIVELSQNGQPIFTFAEVEHNDNEAYLAGIILAGLFATVPIGWYLYWERPRANHVLQAYREKLGHYPQDVRQQLETQTRS